MSITGVDVDARKVIHSGMDKNDTICYIVSMSKYEYTKRWRGKSISNKAYNSEFMRQKRAYYRELFNKGKIKYEDIPKSYRTWKQEDKK